ncbi:hypothetical protein SELR_24730 [Selenomonas ruminantium subsp. lactilytica TAM6421]|uniref:Filamentous haemagglutinin FhaB/tRNA nuclease CdiA-like TPS domain-containing protein n=1 Tax=Selenomonas ruminantium subsp. lactilytica (strain NBRC 103574 / TAM6421) TaxID=927704 RepID=I0GTU4_SELRL|nr:YDG domain-containing protein [Selenomonas ruminantium]BAL84181.1 hypothetical protein SELR_24730 [Selenomonas ruminantium subsp. lactilytica TAM6421]
MERKIIEKKLAGQISLALITGMFSMIPVAYGAPVLDTSKNNTADVSSSGFTTEVVGKQTNNVVNWQDFSVAKGETVQFDADNPNTARNYMNIVTGEKQSQIDGAIKGGNDVYIVNSNGVIFGKDATVDVGSLYVSTTNAIDTTKINDFTANGTNPLLDTAASAAADIVNMGKVTADSVYVEGGNIKFMNTEDIIANKVTANAQGTVRFDHKAGVDTSKFTATNGNRDDYTLITTKDELQNINTNTTTLSGHYALGSNITNVGTFVPVGSSEQPFTGAFDGNYYSVSGININANKNTGYDYAGLFGYVAGSDTQHAKISNLGLVDANIKGKIVAGVLAGYIENTDIENVSVSGTSKLGHFGASFESVGGLIGKTGTGVKVNSVYVTGAEIFPEGSYAIGGIVGKTSGTVEITNSYTTNINFHDSTNSGGIVGQASDTTSISNVYTTATNITKTGGNPSSTYIIKDGEIVGGNNNTTNADATKASSYAFLGDSSSNDTWRIYEGDTLPLLRSFLKANGTVSVNYTYTRDGETTTHNSAEDTVWTYNGKTTTVNVTPSVGDSRNVTIRNQGIYNLFSSTQSGYDYIGNAIIVNPYQIKAGINETTEIRKVYDGTADASAAVGNLFKGTDGSIFEEDTGTVTLTHTVTNAPKFTTDAAGTQESPDVGVGKYVTASGTVTLTGDTYGNYELVDINDAENVGTVTDNVSSLSFSGTSKNGVIEQRELRIELKNATGIKREYNGETTVSDTYKPEAQIQIAADQSENGGLVDGQTVDTIGLTYADLANYVDKKSDNTYSPTKKAGSHLVEYAGIKLNDSTGKNYKLVNANNVPIYSAAIDGLDGSGVNASAGGALYGNGEITPKNISSTDFYWYKDGVKQTDPYKYYDGTSSYKAPLNYTVSNVGATGGMIEGDSLTFTVKGADFVTSATGTLDADKERTAEKTKNVKEAAGVLYTVAISGDSAANYTLDGAVINTSGTNTVIGPGTIKARTLNVVVNPTSYAEKVYDGTDAVKDSAGNTTFSFPGYLKYADSTDTSHHLLGDTDKSTISITGVYVKTGNDAAGKDVNYTQSTTGYSIADKNITYTAAVLENGQASDNYVFSTSNDNTATFEGKGKITPATITGVTFAKATKTYDGTEDVTNKVNNTAPLLANDRITINAVADNQNLGEAVNTIFDVDANGQLAEGSKILTGQYGTFVNGAFKANGNVQRQGTTVVDNKVAYTGLGNLLKNRNYVLADDLSTVAYGDGRINPLEITDGSWIKLDRNDKAITKVYDGNNNVAYGTVKAEDYLTSSKAYVQPADSTKKLDITLTVAGATYEDQHSDNSAAKDVTYKLSVTENGNYSIADSLKTDGYVLKTITDGGKITPKAITVTDDLLVDNNTDSSDGKITKVYDGIKNISAKGENLITIKDQLLTDMDSTYKPTNGITAEFNDKNAGSKTVNYTLALDGDTHNDYYFRNNTVDAPITEWTATGTIQKRTLSLSTTAVPSKEYDTKVDVKKDENFPSLATIDFGKDTTDNTDNNTVVQNDGFAISSLNGIYGYGSNDTDFKKNEDVYRDESGKASNKDVQYSGVLTALGDNAKNYEVQNTFYGKGIIRPSTITQDDFVFKLSDNITQVYSGSATVGEYGMEGDELDAFQRKWINDEASGINLPTGSFVSNSDPDSPAYKFKIDSATFDTADVAKNKTVTYTISINKNDLTNYDYNGPDTFTKSNTINSGEITARPVKATVVHETLTKNYDGGTDLYNGDNKAYSTDTATGTVLSKGDIINLTGLIKDKAGNVIGKNASTGQYTDPNAGDGNKSIEYTPAISGAGNNYKIVDSEGNELTNGKIVTTGNTIKPFGVELTVNKSITKDYDGTPSVAADTTRGVLQLGTNYDGLNSDDLQITENTGVYYDAANTKEDSNVNPDADHNPGTHVVRYTNLAIGNNNYYLADNEGNEITEINGTGVIKPCDLYGNYEFGIGDITKEYDKNTQLAYTGGEYNRDYSEAALKNYLTAPKVTANGKEVPLVFSLDLENTKYEGDGAVGEYTANLRLGISNDNYNYSFANVTINDQPAISDVPQDGVFYFDLTKDNAKITQRHVHVALNDSPLIKKTYDGTTNVEQSVAGNNNKIYMTDSTDFLEGDNVNVDWDNITAAYADENVGNNINVIYNVKLTGDDSDNYELHRYADNLADRTAITAADPLKGTGTITQRELTIDFVKDFHVYDTSADVTNAGDNLKFDNLAERDADFALDGAAKALITGTYTDANVSRAADGTVLDKGLSYEGLQTALADYAQRNNLAKNYSIAVNSVTYAVDDAKGIIVPKEITAPLKAVWQTGVDKVYDATTNLPVNTDADGVLTLQVDTDYDGVLKLQAGEKGYQYDSSSVGYVSKNQGDRALTYTVTGVNANQGNYQLSDAVVSDAVTTWQSTDTSRNVDGASVTGHISPLAINIIEEKDSKIYDGSTVVLDAKSKIHFSDEDQAIINADTDHVDYTVKADYKDKHATEGKTIDYTLTLTGNGNGNYVLGSDTAAITGNTAVGTTKGDIIRRKVYVEALDVDGIDKDYDGTTAMPENYSNAGRFKLKDADKNTGVVADDKDIVLNIDAIQGEYTNKHVGTHAINFTNFALQDNDTANDNITADYDLQTTSLTGSGTISPKALTVAINEAPTKEYDANSNLSDAYNTKDNLTLSGVVGDDNVNWQLISAGYANANADTGKEYSYSVSIDNADYKLSQGTDLPTITVAAGGQSGVIKAYDGVIEKRKVYVSLDAEPSIVKTYDGNTSVEQVVSDKIIVRDGDLLTSLDGTDLDRSKSAINARYDSKDAGNRTVTYDVVLSGDAAGNYEIHRLANFGTAEDGEYSTLEGTGVINKAVLTLDPLAVSKTYNGTNVIGDGTLATDDALTTDKLIFKGVNNESFTLTDAALAEVSGTYSDADVSWNGDEVAHKDVTYTGLSNALDVMNASDSTNSISKNYTIEDTASFTADQAKGKINPMMITSVTENWKPVIREYNADTDLNEVYDYTGGVKGEQLGINDILTLSATDPNGNPVTVSYTAAGAYDDKNVRNDHVLNYHINSVQRQVKDANNKPNFALSDAVMNSLVGQDVDSADENVLSTITVRQLNAEVLNTTGNSKVYDGTINADSSNFALDDDDIAVLTKDGILDKAEITANYINKHASANPGEITNYKQIYYTLSLDDNSGNYEVVTPQGFAWGDIEKRPVYVEPLNIDNIEKEYDGTTSMPAGYTNADHFQLAAADESSGIVTGDKDIQLNLADITGTYADSHVQRDAEGNVVAQDITFTGFALTDTLERNGGDLGDYYLVADDVITGSIKIQPRALTVGINAAPVKGYDATRNLSTEYDTPDNLTLSTDRILAGEEVNWQYIGGAYADANAAEGKEYSYTVSIDNLDYTLAQGADLPTIEISNKGQNGVITADDGVINPRKVYVSLADTPVIGKIYDGNTAVTQDVSNKIVVRDGDLLTDLDGTQLNRSNSVINARYDSKDAGDRTVTYDVVLSGEAAGNYEIHRLDNLGTDADGAYSTLEGTGVINKAVLTLTPLAVNKTYNGTAVVGDGTLADDDQLTADKLIFTGVNGESFTLSEAALAKVSGQYGSGSSANDFAADANVSWNGEEVAYKDVLYTGLSNALDVMNADDSTNSISKNYTIDNTAYFAAALAKGKIKPITITQAATENWKPVIREYNADTDLKEVYDYSDGSAGEQLGINDILKLTVTGMDGHDLTIDYEAVGNYDDKNVGGTHVLNYHINSVNTKVNDGSGNANYVLDTSVLEALAGKDLDSSAEGVYSVITPRQINADVVNAIGNRKIYDGTVVADTGNFVLDTDDQAVLAKDELLNKITITAYYDDKHASVAPEAADTNSKTITYTLGLSDESGNYEIATPVATAAGDIEQRKVYVEPVKVDGIDKVYDATTDMADNYTSSGRFKLAATGLVAGDSDIWLNTESIKGQYEDGHVHRNDDGTLATQQITFTNFTLQDVYTENDNSVNDYYVATTSLNGSGTITPAALTVDIVSAPVKAYDGETAISDIYASNTNVSLGGILDGDSVNVLINSAAYSDANAGTNKEYSYDIAIDNGDYELTQGAASPDITVTNYGQNGVITADDGVITPRVLTASVIGEMTKVYDGTTDGVENAEANISLSNYITKDKGNLGLTAVATYDNANAGISETSDELVNHTVSYTLSLGNSNYQLEDSVVEGTGTISRKGLNIVATPAAVFMGDEMPEFSGSVEGLVATDSTLADSFVFAPYETTTTSNPGYYEVYGWYSNRISGNLGLNYTFAQDAGNDTALTVNVIPSNDNPDTGISAGGDIYQQISHDMNSGFGDTGIAVIEYQDGQGNVVGTETINSGEIHGGNMGVSTDVDATSQGTKLATMGIVGNDIVNTEGVDAAGIAHVEVSDDGQVVNLEVNPLEDDGKEDKSVVQKKKSQIAIEGSDSDEDDEIEVEVKNEGVNVA